MLSPRSVICVPDVKDGRQWVGPLGAVGSVVNVVASAAEVAEGTNFLLTRAGKDPAVLQAVLARAHGDTNAAVLLPTPELGPMLEVLKYPCVKAAIVEDYLDVRLLTYISAKAIWGDIFGVSKVVPWGVKIHSELVNTHEERNQALASVAHFAKTIGLRKKYREAIELVLDELLMNALYNAPVDPGGRPVFLEVQPKDRPALRLERPAILQVACDGARFALSVRDSFGSLRRDTILTYLERAASSSGQMENKTSGAGLGLYLVANNVTEFIANILPGTATEMIAIFDIQAARQQLKHVGIYEESFARHADSRGSGAASLVGAPQAAAAAGGTNKLVTITLATAVILLLVAGMLMVYPFMKKPARGNLQVEVVPSGATVYVNGVRKGQAAPRLLLKDLDVATTYSVTARLPGYDEARDVVNVDAERLATVRLVLPSQKARIKILSSTPEGAQVMLDGKSTGLKTPALLEGLEPNKRHEIRLEKYGFKGSSDMVTPTAEETLNLQVKLPLAQGFATVSLTSDPSGGRFLVNEVDTGLKTPVREHVLRADLPYNLKVTSEGFVPWTAEVKPREAELIERAVKLSRGGSISVSANIPGHVTVAGIVTRRLPLVNQMVPEGTYKIHVIRKELNVEHTFMATIKAGSTINRQLFFGFIAGAKKEVRIKLDKKKVPRIARLPGRHPVTIVNVKTGKTKDINVDVVAKETVLVE